MADTNLTQRVRPGIEEYYTRSTPDAGDTINFHFDSPFQLNDLIIDQTDSTSCTYDVNLIYPASQMTLPITTSQSSNYYLNADQSTRNLWYRIPAWTILQISVSSATSAVLEVTAIGSST